MRRKKQELSKEECIDILQTAKTAVLGVVGDILKALFCSVKQEF